MSAEKDEFFARHRGGTGNVVVAWVLKDGERDQISVFGSIEQANAWANRFNEDDGYVCVFVPFVVDEPDYGNVPKRERQ